MIATTWTGWIGVPIRIAPHMKRGAWRIWDGELVADSMATVREIVRIANSKRRTHRGKGQRRNRRLKNGRGSFESAKLTTGEFNEP